MLFSKGNPAKTCVLVDFSWEIDECIAFWRVLGEPGLRFGLGGGGRTWRHPQSTDRPRAHGPSKTARFTMFCGGDPAKTRVSARFGAEIMRFTWFSKGHPAETRVLAGFGLEIDECIAFWRVWGEGPETVEILD